MPINIVNPELRQFTREHLESIDRALTWNNAITKYTRGELTTAYNELGKAYEALLEAKVGMRVALKAAERALGSAAADRDS